MYNVNSGFGALLANAIYGTNPSFGKTFLVIKNDHPNWNMITQMFYRQDPDGELRLFETIQDAVNEASSGRGDVIYVAPDADGYDETVTVSRTDNLTIVGLGGRGAAFIEPQTAGAEGLQISESSDVTLVNLGVAGEATSNYALNLHSATRFRAYGCKLEGPTDATKAVVLLDGTATDQTADALLKDCEICWGGRGIVFDDSAYGYVTQVFIEDCKFHNIEVTHIGVNTNGLVKNLELTNCVFDNLEDGTAPIIAYILLSDNGNTGVISGNQFATPTNLAAVLTIGTDLLWVANATEAGWSTARPA